ARAAITHGRDDATALALGAFVIRMVEHDRVTAFDAFQQALALSPSSSFTLFLCGVALAFGGEAERAIDWAQRALRLSPFDRLNYTSYQALAIGHFLRERYEEARVPHVALCNPIRASAHPIACSRRRLPNSGNWRKRKPLLCACWHCNHPLAQLDSALPSHFRSSSPSPWRKLGARPACRHRELLTKQLSL